ncbi:MAG: hypothetical protein NTX44_06635 [Ignavibacteriales bacterium]|nr:hypothetical protein [Ignavibacteriales bacterium]
MITFIKTLHTVIWVIMTLSVCYIGYSVARMHFDILFYISFFLIMTESMVIAINAWKCPLTNVARKYTEEKTANFDIYLPEFIAHYNKEIFSIILCAIVVFYLYNLIK